jgi:hypothetical protein
MTDRNSHLDEKLFETAWSRFADEDASAEPPSDLEARTMAAWHLSRSRLRDDRRRIHPRLMWGVAAGAAAVLLAFGVHRGREIADLDTGGSVASSQVAREWRVSPLPPALVRLAADPILDTETLQLVRVRVPRSALRAMGVVVVESDPRGTVEVEVLVGEDGLPRDVRRIEAIRD